MAYLQRSFTNGAKRERERDGAERKSNQLIAAVRVVGWESFFSCTGGSSSSSTVRIVRSCMLYRSKSSLHQMGLNAPRLSIPRVEEEKKKENADAQVSLFLLLCRCRKGQRKGLGCCSFSSYPSVCIFLIFLAVQQAKKEEEVGRKS